ncbi:hypothetical protein BDN71DRAFT_1436571 [Pleurotus eryngii]|uniref:Uncharacterized protein n=1 Tax=Pleurotus eryngii TaxID=5323 RepID=A0A9P6D9L9_PLEER|nr:hypothetical protein BDN71DRAFT_1436571 [Pleurotus eryngii]
MPHNPSMPSPEHSYLINPSTMLDMPSLEKSPDTQPLKLSHGWAVGFRLAYLNQSIRMYKEGLASKKRKQALDGIVNGYFEQYHWRIPIHTEPDLTTPDPKTQNSEKLTAEEKILQGKVIDKNGQGEPQHWAWQGNHGKQSLCHLTGTPHWDLVEGEAGDVTKECAKWLLDWFNLKKPEEWEYWNNLAHKRHKQSKQAMEDLLSNDIELTSTHAMH